MFDQRMTLNRRVPVRFVRGCFSRGRPYNEGDQAQLDPQEAGELLGQSIVELVDRADLQVLKDHAAAAFRQHERELQRFERRQR